MSPKTLCQTGSHLTLLPRNWMRFLKRLQGGDAVLEMDLLGAVEAKEELWVPRENACALDKMTPQS